MGQDGSSFVTSGRRYNLLIMIAPRLQRANLALGGNTGRAYLPAVTNDVQVEGIVPGGGQQILQPVVGFFHRHIRANQSKSPGDAMNVRVDREGGPSQ